MSFILYKNKKGRNYELIPKISKFWMNNYHLGAEKGFIVHPSNQYLLLLLLAENTQRNEPEGTGWLRIAYSKL